MPGDVAVDKLHVDVVSAAEAGDSTSRFEVPVVFGRPPSLVLVVVDRPVP